MLVSTLVSPLVSILARTLSTRRTLRRYAHPLTPHEIVPMLIGSTVEAIERELVLQTLARCDGNRTHAARLLGFSVRTMRNKIKQYATDRGRYALAQLERFERSMPSDSIRGWTSVRVKKTRQDKGLEPQAPACCAAAFPARQRRVRFGLR